MIVLDYRTRPPFRAAAAIEERRVPARAAMGADLPDYADERQRRHLHATIYLLPLTCAGDENAQPASFQPSRLAVCAANSNTRARDK